MSAFFEQFSEHIDVASICRGRVVAVTHDGQLFVDLDADGDPIYCDVVLTSAGNLDWNGGEHVLVWRASVGATGVVIGRIGKLLNKESASQEIPDSLVLEAKHSLTLRVGEGSITIREDGKILIKGKDLVSHAQRMNRIKGGAVSIN